MSDDSLDLGFGVDLLIVDDDETFLEQEKIFLRRELGSGVIEAVNSAQDALNSLDNNDFDCVVSDYQMPGMDGLDLLENIREVRGNDVPFIIFTGQGREEVAMEALNLGVDRYLQKGGSSRTQYGVLSQAIEQVVKHHDTEERLKLTSFSLENINAGAFWVMPGGVIKYSNKRICEMLGYDRGEIIGMSVSELNPNYSDQRTEIWEELKEEGEVTFETQLRKSSGDIIPVKVDSYYLEREGSEYEFAFVREISEERKAKEWRETFNSLEDSIFIVDKDRNIELVNEATEELIEGLDESWKGNKCFDLILDENHPMNSCPIEKSLESGEPEETEFYSSKHDKYFLARTQPIKDENGNVKKFINQVQDITKRKKFEEDLKESKKKYKSLFDNSPVVVWEEDLSEVKNYLNKLKQDVDNLEKYFDRNPDEVNNILDMIDVVDVNEKAREFYNADSKDELLNNLDEVFVDESFNVFKEELLSIARGNYHYRSVNKTKTLDGEEKIVLFEVRVPEEYRDDYSTVFVSSIDITEKHHLKQKLEKTRDKLNRENEKIKKLHHITSKLESVKSREEICNIAMNAAEEILEFKSCLINLVEGNELIPKATCNLDKKPVSKDLDEDGLDVRTFKENESYLVNDLDGDDGIDLDSNYQESIISVPVGEKGVFQAVASEKQAFNENDLKMAELLASHVSEALKSVEADEREEFLHSLLRHDVRNKAQVVLGYHELLKKLELPEEAEELLKK